MLLRDVDFGKNSVASRFTQPLRTTSLDPERGAAPPVQIIESPEEFNKMNNLPELLSSD